MVPDVADSIHHVCMLIHYEKEIANKKMLRRTSLL